MSLVTRRDQTPAGPGVSWLILWAGPKHSGKTTSAQHLVHAIRQRGFIVGGFVAPSLYDDGRLIGFDIVDLGTGERAPLARRETNPSSIGGFNFLPEGLRLGTDSLAPAATDGADIIVVDEYGPLELANHGWRTAVDHMMTSTDAAILLVVRQGLADQIRQVYAQFRCRKLPANEPESVEQVIALLRDTRAEPLR